MSLSEGDGNFKWGKVVKTDNGPQCYDSFVYKGVKYFLYDCIFVLHVHSMETSIGKIVKMWEDSTREKKLKVICFFRPKDVIKFLHVEPRWNELYLASGKGKGVCDTFKVGDILGKCKVLYKSDDKINPPASDLVVKEADYYFSSTFDVGTRTVLTSFPEAIEKVAKKLLYSNRRRKVTFDESSITESVNGKKARIADSGSGSLRKVPQKPEDDSYNEVSAGTINDMDGSPGTFRHTGDVQPSTTSVTDTTLKGRDLNIENEEDVVMPGRKRIKEGDANVSVKEYNRDLSRGTKSLLRGGEKAGDKVIYVTSKPASDLSKWFNEELQPWEDRLQRAHQEGKLVFLTNLNPSYTSSEVEDLIYAAFQAKADAKIIPRVAHLSPHYGQAFAIFRRKETADMVITRLMRRNLIQVHGRPLVASRKDPVKPTYSGGFPGHLIISDPKLKRSEAQRNAVSTSHSAQANTIEYDFALQWKLLQERSDLNRKTLHQVQEEERQVLQNEFKKCNTDLKWH